MRKTLLASLCLAALPAIASDLVKVTVDADQAVRRPAVSGGLAFTQVKARNAVTLRPTQMPTGFATEYHLTETVARPTDVWVLEDKIIALGEIGTADVQEIDIFDGRSGSLLDTFWGLDVSVSPDGAKVAFVRPYPRMGVDGVESQYMVFDLTHVRGGKLDLTDLSRRFNAGEQVYPHTSRPNIGVSSLEAHTLMSRIAWRSDGKEFGFLDAVNGQAYLTVVTLIDGGSAGDVKRRLVPELNKLCTLRSSDDCLNSPPNEIEFSFSQQDVRITAPHGGKSSTFQVSRAGLSPTQP